MTLFADLGIRQDLLKGLESLGFTSPTPVQSRVIPLIIEDREDFVILAQTGTGKTAAFGIPLIQGIDTHTGRPQGLILCPTRELCVQVSSDLANFGKFVKGIGVTAVYGGASIERQVSALRRGSQVIVATPGRLNDLIRRKQVDLSAIRTVVLDEADEMLQMGFQDELNTILAQTPDEKNTLLFSATMPKGISTIAKKYMNNPQEITVGEKNAGAANIKHIYYMVQARDRYTALKRLADFNPDIYSIVFCRTRQETKDVADKLIQDGYSADALHGELSQGQRDHVMNKFRKRTMQILVATDVAARGLDVNDLTHVINYNLPDDSAAYTHRSGRTGRAGKLGISISIIHIREIYRIREIERQLKKKMEQGRLPSGQEVCQQQMLKLVTNLQKLEVDHKQLDPLLKAMEEKLGELDRDDLIKRLVSLEFKRVLDDYRHAPDLNVSRQPEKQRPLKSGPKKPGQPAGPQLTRFRLNVGKNDGIRPKSLIGEINDVAGGSRIRIGKIEIMKHSAMLEADARFAPQILKAFEHLYINGKPVSVEVVANRTQSPPKRKRPAAPYAKPEGKRPFRRPKY